LLDDTERIRGAFRRRKGRGVGGNLAWGGGGPEFMNKNPRKVEKRSEGRRTNHSLKEGGGTRKEKNAPKGQVNSPRGPKTT